jgi:hypothetical protein
MNESTECGGKWTESLATRMEIVHLLFWFDTKIDIHKTTKIKECFRHLMNSHSGDKKAKE